VENSFGHCYWAHLCSLLPTWMIGHVNSYLLHNNLKFYNFYLNFFFNCSFGFPIQRRPSKMRESLHRMPNVPRFGCHSLRQYSKISILNKICEKVWKNI
jgi:hypothetical protein